MGDKMEFFFYKDNKILPQDFSICQLDDPLKIGTKLQ
jgi:hypothetical protein